MLEYFFVHLHQDHSRSQKNKRYLNKKIYNWYHYRHPIHFFPFLLKIYIATKTTRQSQAHLFLLLFFKIKRMHCCAFLDGEKKHTKNNLYCCSSFLNLNSCILFCIRFFFLLFSLSNKEPKNTIVYKNEALSFFVTKVHSLFLFKFNCCILSCC